MKKYAELGHVYRCEPCVEYPGVWIVYAQNEQSDHPSLDSAMKQAMHIHDILNVSVSVCWAASEDDPRVGQVWFTGFYCHTRLRSY